MNRNLKSLIDYFESNKAISENTAVDIDSVSIDGVSGEKLQGMMCLMDDMFHKRSDGKWWYEKKPFEVNIKLTPKDIIIGMVVIIVLTILKILFI